MYRHSENLADSQGGDRMKDAELVEEINTSHTEVEIDPVLKAKIDQVFVSLMPSFITQAVEITYPRIGNLDLEASINQVMADLMPSFVTQAAEAICPRVSGFDLDAPTTQPAKSDLGGDGIRGDLHDWQRRFCRLRPPAFRGAAKKMNAKNWIFHMERILEKIECPGKYWVQIASSKLQGDTQKWWQQWKQDHGSSTSEEAIAWNEFRVVFYHQYVAGTIKAVNDNKGKGKGKLN